MIEMKNSARMGPFNSREVFSTLSITAVAYFIFLTQFLIHNHGPRLPWAAKTDQLQAGRWFNYFLSAFNYQADIPVLFPIIGIVASVACAFLALSIWRLDLTSVERVIVASALTTFPVSLAYFYYTFQTPLFYAAWVFAVVGACFALKDKLIHTVIASLLVMLACASNQTSVNIFPVLIATAMIARLSDPRTNLADTFWLAFRAGLVLVSGLLLYVISLEVLGISAPNGSTITPFGMLPEQIQKAVRSSFVHLWLIQPELLRFQKCALLAVLITAIGLSIYRTMGDLPRVLLMLLMWAAAIIGTKMLFLVVQPGSYFDYRYSGALAFLHAFTFAYVLGSITCTRRIIRYAFTAALAFLCLRFVQADLIRQGVLLRGQQHDLAIANRILTRIENLPGLDTSQTYDLVRIGRYADYRSNLLASGGNRAQLPGDGHMDYGEITDFWTDESVFRFLGSPIKFGPGFKDFSQKIDAARKSQIQGRKPWPDPSSVFISDKTIYVYMR